jgi:hypothetical protein
MACLTSLTAVSMLAVMVLALPTLSHQYLKELGLFILQNHLRVNDKCVTASPAHKKCLIL